MCSYQYNMWYHYEGEMKEVLWSLTTTMNKHNKKSLIQTIEPFNRPVMILAKNNSKGKLFWTSRELPLSYNIKKS